MGRALKRSWGALLVALVCAALAVLSPMAWAEDDSTSYTVIEVDETCTVDVTAEGEWAYFSFTPESSGSYQICTAGAADTLAYLYDADWTELAENDDSGEEQNARLIGTLEAGETYYVGVLVLDSGGASTYTLSVALWDPEATALSLDETVEFTLAASDTTYLTFTPETSGYYGIVIAGASEASAALYDDFWNELSSGYTSSDEETLSLSAELEAGTTYYIELVDSSGAAATATATVSSLIDIAGATVELPDGTEYVYEGETIEPAVTVTYEGELLEEGVDYTLEYYGGYFRGISEVFVDGCGSYGGTVVVYYEVEIAESLIGALAVGEEQGDALTEYTEVAYYSFTSEASGWYTLELEVSTDSTLYLYRYDADWTYLEGAEGNGTVSCTFYIAAGESCYFELWMHPSDLEFDPSYTVLLSEAEVTVRALELGVEVEVELDSTTAFACFSFTPSATGLYTISSAGDSDAYAILYDAAGTELAYADDTSEGVNASIVAGLAAGETYYIVFKTWDSTASSSFTVVAEEAEIEITELTLGVEATASFAAAGDAAYFSFTPTASGSYTFSSLGEYNTWATLYDAAWTELAEDDDSGEDENAAITYELEAGSTYYVVFTHNQSDYTSDFQVVVEAEPISLAAATVTISSDSLTYDGTAQEPAVSVELDGVALEEGADYTVEYADNVDAGTATVTVAGCGSYAGTVTATFTIAAQELSEEGVTLAYDSAECTGSALEPQVTVVDAAGAVLEEGVDYTVEYADNTEVGTATVTVTGAGNYTGEVVKTFAITDPASSLASATVTISSDSLTYDGTAQEPAVTVELDGVALEEGTDYTVEYADNVDAGTATVTITGCGDYSGTVSETFTISTAITRLAGSNRYETMAKIVAEAYEGETSEWAVIATGTNFADALAAASLAGALDAPILLVSDGNVGYALAALYELGVTRAYIVGGTAAVSTTVQSQVEALGVTVIRLSGDTRVETALAVAAEVLAITGSSSSSTCFVAAGWSFPDALSASPYSYWAGAPIYLAKKDGSISAEVLTAIARGGYEQVIVLGGTDAVSAVTYARLSALTGVSVTRLGGANRYETSALVAAWSVAEGMSYDGAAVATGVKFPDALAGATICGRSGSVILLAKDENVTALELLADASGVNEVYILGGTSAVSESLEEALAELLG